MKNRVADKLWVWYCSGCGNEQFQEKAPEYYGEALTCTICSQLTFVSQIPVDIVDGVVQPKEEKCYCIVCIFKRKFRKWKDERKKTTAKIAAEKPKPREGRTLNENLLPNKKD